MIGTLASMYSAIAAKQQAYQRYLNAKLSRVHLADQVSPRMGGSAHAAIARHDQRLIAEAEQAVKLMAQFQAMEDEAMARFNREMRAKEYRTALGYLG